MLLRKNVIALTCCLAIITSGGTLALAAEEDVEEISVVGSRSHERSASDLAVPVDVLDSSELTRQGDSRMDSMLSRIVPSLNVSQEPISDAATLVRPAQMRGLSPDSTLVLVNGKRRHRSSIISFLVAGGSEGSHAPDLSAIPAIALDRVEVLRDGAAAQYGSDAVAGILNFVLKEEAQGGSVEARWGRYYQGDGENGTVSWNFGLPLTQDGFFNASGEINEANPTSRSVQRNDAQALIDAGNTHVRTPAAQVWGAPDIDDNYKLFANAGIGLGDSHEAYAFGSYAERTVEGGFYYRHPHKRGGIFEYPDTNLSRLNSKLKEEGKDGLPPRKVMVISHRNPDRTDQGGLIDLSMDEIEALEFPMGKTMLSELTDEEITELGLVKTTENDTDTYRRAPTDDEIMANAYPDDNPYCPDINVVDGVIDQNDLQAVNDDPDCFAFHSRFPGGFTPQFGGDVEDSSIAIGLRGELSENLTYDISYVTGKHEVDFFMKNTINPQLASTELDIPTLYKPGGYVEEDWTFNLDLTTEIDIEAFHSPLSVGFGMEYREEEYEIKPGEERSWFIDYIHAVADEDAGIEAGDEFDEPNLLSISCDDYREFVNKIGDGEIEAKYPNLGIGSNGFPGFRPEPCISNKNDRSSFAAYVDFEADVAENMLMGLAIRHEDAENFDSTLDGKFSARFQATDKVAIRGSFSTGFRVPTVGQAEVRNVTTTLVDGRLTDELTLPPTDPVLAGIASPLEAEESVSSAFGTVLNVGALDVTIDYYHIEVKDRISLTSTEFLDCLLLDKDGLRAGNGGGRKSCGKGTKFDINLNALDQPISDRIAELRDELRPVVPAIDSVAQVRYFANDFDTTTDGIDIVATYPAEFFGGVTQLTFAGNYNRTTVDEFDPRTISSRTKQQIEEGRPKIRWSLTADHQEGPWRVLGRVRYYGTHIDYHALSADLFQRVDARFLTDLEVGYNLTDDLSFVVGAENLLDEEPSKNIYDKILGSEYPESIPFDYNGGFFYFKAIANF